MTPPVPKQNAWPSFQGREPEIQATSSDRNPCEEKDAIRPTRVFALLPTLEIAGAVRTAAPAPISRAAVATELRTPKSYIKK